MHESYATDASSRERADVLEDVVDAYETVTEEYDLDQQAATLDGGDRFRPIVELTWAGDDGRERLIRAAVTENCTGYQVGVATGVHTGAEEPHESPYDLETVGTVDEDAASITGAIQIAVDQAMER